MSLLPLPAAARRLNSTVPSTLSAARTTKVWPPFSGSTLNSTQSSSVAT